MRLFTDVNTLSQFGQNVIGVMSVFLIFAFLPPLLLVLELFEDDPFFWSSLSPLDGGDPPRELAERIMEPTAWRSELI